ncbi:hypothetical protein J6590_067109 [Homalodisca vitripennis]|nr:hypothetical protein J6590_067109 [Homalodisca vitripennis]
MTDINVSRYKAISTRVTLHQELCRNANGGGDQRQKVICVDEATVCLRSIGVGLSSYTPAALQLLFADPHQTTIASGLPALIMGEEITVKRSSVLTKLPCI